MTNKILILGHGPSTNMVLNHLDEIKEHGVKLMSLNNYYKLRDNMPLDYAVCDHPFTKPYDYYPNMSKDIKYFFHFGHAAGDMSTILKDNGFLCEEFFCKSRESGKTIQDRLFEISGNEEKCTQGASGILYCMILSVLEEFSDIYYIGVELDYRARYAGDRNNGGVPKEWKQSSWLEAEQQFDRLRPRILKDIRVIKNSAKKIGAEFHNLTYEKENTWRLRLYE